MVMLLNSTLTTLKQLLIPYIALLALIRYHYAGIILIETKKRKSIKWNVSSYKPSILTDKTAKFISSPFGPM